MGRLPTVEVDLGGGDKVVLHKHLLVKTQRAMQAFCLESVPEDKEVTPDALKGKEKEIVEIFFTNQALFLQVSTMDQIKVGPFRHRRLRRHTFSPPFNYAHIMQVMDDVGLEKLSIIERAMNRLYVEDPKE